jgi:heme exporter protein D
MIYALLILTLVLVAALVLERAAILQTRHPTKMRAARENQASKCCKHGGAK